MRVSGYEVQKIKRDFGLSWYSVDGTVIQVCWGPGFRSGSKRYVVDGKVFRRLKDAVLYVKTEMDVR